MGVFVIGLSGTGRQACPPPHNSRADASAQVTATRGSHWDHEHPAPDLGAHEPVRWRLGRVEQRVAGPHVINVIDSKCGCLNRCAVWVSISNGSSSSSTSRSNRSPSADECITNDYRLVSGASRLMHDMQS